MQAKIGTFLSVLDRAPCSTEVPQLRLIRRLGKKLRRARAKIGLADVALGIPRITRLLERASALLSTAKDVLAQGETAGWVSTACAADLRAFLDDLRVCVEGVPRR